MTGGIGYEFHTVRSSTGCLILDITPHNRRHDFTSKRYVFTPDEVRALIGVLDILPDDGDASKADMNRAYSRLMAS